MRVDELLFISASARLAASRAFKLGLKRLRDYFNDDGLDTHTCLTNASLFYV